jgi:MFS family permease
VGLAKIMAISMSMFGISVSLFSFSRSLVLSMFLMVLVGFSMVSSMVSCNTFIQTLVDDDKRSRVMSLYIVSILGIAPLGSLNAGGVASVLGAPLTLAAGGIVCVATGIILLKQYPKMWQDAIPVYRRKNLL